MDKEHLLAVTAQFPKGCRIRRKPGHEGRQSTSLDSATVSEVVMTGIHRDVFLKIGDGFTAKYLEPDAYDLMVD